MIYLGATQTAKQSGTTAEEPMSEADRLKQMEFLSPEERRKLRMARFGGGKDKMPGLEGAATTVEALKLMEEQKKKMLERCERFGIMTK